MKIAFTLPEVQLLGAVLGRFARIHNRMFVHKMRDHLPGYNRLPIYDYLPSAEWMLKGLGEDITLWANFDEI